MNGEDQKKVIENSNKVDNNSLLALVSVVLITMTMFVFRQHRNNFLWKLKNSQCLKADEEKKEEHSIIFTKYLKPIMEVCGVIITLASIFLALRKIKKDVFDPKGEDNKTELEVKKCNKELIIDFLLDIYQNTSVENEKYGYYHKSLINNDELDKKVINVDAKKKAISFKFLQFFISAAKRLLKAENKNVNVNEYFNAKKDTIRTFFYQYIENDLKDILEILLEINNNDINFFYNSHIDYVKYFYRKDIEQENFFNAKNPFIRSFLQFINIMAKCAFFVSDQKDICLRNHGDFKKELGSIVRKIKKEELLTIDSNHYCFDNLQIYYDINVIEKYRIIMFQKYYRAFSSSIKKIHKNFNTLAQKLKLKKNKKGRKAILEQLLKPKKTNANEQLANDNKGIKDNNISNMNSGDINNNSKDNKDIETTEVAGA